MKKLFSTLLFSLLFVSRALALDVPAPPLNYVRDDANIFSVDVEREFDATIKGIEDDTSAEIAILTVPALEDQAIEDYAVDVFREWGVGQAGVDNGLLLLIAVEDHLVRIEVGYGLEGRVTDYNADAIISDRIIPAFREENYEQGVRDALTDLSALIHQEATEEGFGTQTSGEDTGNGLTETIFTSIFPVFIFGVFAYAGWTILLTALPEDKANKIKRWPVPHGFMALLLAIWGVGLVGWVLGLGVAQFIYMDMAKADLKKMKEKRGGGGGPSDSGGGFGGGFSDSSSSSGSMGHSSGGQSFGGGSSGGGGATKKW